MPHPATTGSGIIHLTGPLKAADGSACPLDALASCVTTVAISVKDKEKMGITMCMVHEFAPAGASAECPAFDPEGWSGVTPASEGKPLTGTRPCCLSSLPASALTARRVLHSYYA